MFSSSERKRETLREFWKVRERGKGWREKKKSREDDEEEEKKAMASV